MKRRGFFGAIIAAAAAPAIVRASSLMPISASKIIMPSMEIITPNDAFETHLYKGNGTAQTIQHSLGYEPQYILVRPRNSDKGWIMQPLKG